MRGSVLLAALLLVSCAQHEERLITPWLKIDVHRPAGGNSGVVVLGATNEDFYARVGGRWLRVGRGHASTYMVLDEERAILFDLHDGRGLQLAREDRLPQAVADLFGSGDVVVLPDQEAIDVFHCNVAAMLAGCRDAHIERYAVDGSRLATFSVVRPDAYPDCQILGIVRYDIDKTPYTYAQCKTGSTAQCVVVAPRKTGTFVYAVASTEPPAECSDLSHAGVSFQPPASFTIVK